MTDVVVVGQIGRDLVLQVDDLSADGSSRVHQRRELLGGKGANQAVGLAQLGVEVALVGVVGDDPVGADMLDQAARDGIDVRAVVRRGTTALLLDVVDESGRRRLIEDVPELLTTADVPTTVSAGLLSLQAQQPPSVLAVAARRFRGMVVCDGAVTDDELLARTDLLRADHREIEQMTGERVDDEVAARRIAQQLRERGPSIVALPVPDIGDLVAWEGGQRLFSYPDVGVVDTTGAGDAFVAGMVAGLLRTNDPERAGVLASMAAASTVARLGGRPDLRSLAEA